MAIDTPDNAEVLQDEKPCEHIPVSVENVVRVDEMPTILSEARHVLLKAGSRAQKVLNDNPRRKRIYLWPITELDEEQTRICIAPTEAECNAFSGAILESGGFGVSRYEFAFKSELWARPVIVNHATGNVTGLAESTDDMILSIVTEQWSN